MSMHAILFLREFFKNPRYIGAITPSSSALAKAMVGEINFEKATYIVELGPGTGSFTKELIKKKKKQTTLILVELNDEFVKKLREKYGSIPNVHVVHGSAENLKEYLNEMNIEQADYIISGLPFTSLPKEGADRILRAVYNTLKMDGRFITFQYSLVKKEYIQTFFQGIRRKRVWSNFPPAYVFSCNKGGN
jgi:phosphatidylethanolamine/phosphatidyl-N-methylethanolamine N-methyltransferase